MTELESTLRRKLMALADPSYKKFQAGLMPTVNPAAVLGVRMPALRRLAKETVRARSDWREYLSCLPHVYYEENNLHGLLLERLGEYEKTIAALEAFLPYVDNWATCDLMNPPVFRENRPVLLGQCEAWLEAEHEYAVRFGMGMLLRHFLDEDFSPRILSLVAGVRREEYYIRMMQAWFFAEALAKQYEAAQPFLESGVLSDWVRRKTVQKVRESFRIPAERKDALRALK